MLSKDSSRKNITCRIELQFEEYSSRNISQGFYSEISIKSYSDGTLLPPDILYCKATSSAIESLDF